MSIVLDARKKYWQMLKAIFGTPVIGYWRLDDRSGTTAKDWSGGGLDGAYNNITLGQAGINDGGKGAAFNTSRLTIYSSSLASLFNGDEGFLMMWAKVGDWSTATRMLAYLSSDNSSNRIFVQQPGVANDMRFARYPGATYTDINLDLTNMFCIGFTWSRSNNRQRIYINGVQFGADITGLTVWSGALNSNYAAIGNRYGTSDSSNWLGTMQHVVLGNAEATAAQMWLAANAIPPAKTGGVLFRFDDGLPSIINTVYPTMAARGLRGNCYVVSDWIGNGSYMTWTNLQTLYAAGWDICSHTKDHTDLTTLNASQIDTELSTCKTAIETNNMPRASMHMAYPYGGVNATVRTEMGKYGVLTGLLASQNKNALPKVNAVTDIPDQYIRDTYPTSLTALYNIVKSAWVTGQVAVLLIHDPGANGQISVANFQSLVDFIVANGIPVMTISEYYARATG